MKTARAISLKTMGLAMTVFLAVIVFGGFFDLVSVQIGRPIMEWAAGVGFVAFAVYVLTSSN